jgi:hypothetical protein
MSYFRLVVSRAWNETSKVWNANKVWEFAAVPIIGFLLHAWIRGTRLNGWQEVLLFVIFGLAVTLAGNYLINLIRVPAILHAELVSDKLGLESRVSSESEKSLALREQIAELKKPAIDPVAESILAEVRGFLMGTSDLEKKVLKHILINEGILDAGASVIQLSRELDMENSTPLVNSLQKLSDAHLLAYHNADGSSRQVYWNIPEGYRDAIRRLLFA